MGKVANDGEYLTHKIELKAKPERDIRSFFVKQEGKTNSPPMSPSKKIESKNDIRRFFKSEVKEEANVKKEIQASVKRESKEDNKRSLEEFQKEVIELDVSEEAEVGHMAKKVKVEHIDTMQ